MLSLHVCQNYFKEIDKVVKDDEFSQLNIQSFPARCGQPPMDLNEIGLLTKKKTKDSHVVFGSHCLSRLDTSSNAMNKCRVKKLDQCFYFFCQAFFVDRLQTDGGYVLTPGWLENWENNIERWGFDQKTAIEFFKNSIKKLVLLDTGSVEKSLENISKFSNYLGLPYEIVTIDLEFFKLYLKNIINKYKIDKLSAVKSKAQKQAADSALIQETLNQLIKQNTEKKIINSFITLITLLMAPEKVEYLSSSNYRFNPEKWVPFKGQGIKKLFKFFNDGNEQILIADNNKSFFIKIIGTDQVVGLAKIENIAFTKYMNKYINVAVNISGIFGLAIENIRSFEKLITTSHIAGKAELATEILHNVGNVLNSVNISTEQILELLQKSSTKNIEAVSDLIKKNKEDLVSFFTTNEKGIKLPLYLQKLSEQVSKEQKSMLMEASSQKKKIELISEIIHSQQNYSKDTVFGGEVDLEGLIEESILLNHRAIEKYNITINKDLERIPVLISHRSKILQIITNLLINAVDAVAMSENKPKKICFYIYPHQNNQVRLEISDNGIGIQNSIASMIFLHGFSTKPRGYGFGLHNAANHATELSGSLSFKSLGKEKGSRFYLTIPLNPQN